MRRVAILGCGGSGKSTLARHMASITGLPLVHLDREYWRPGWVEPPKEEWQNQLAQLVDQPAWVMDGNYGGTLPARLTAADAVVFLDFPRWICLYRVIRRALIYRGRSRPDMPEGCPEQFGREFRDFLLWIWRWPRDSRPRLATAIEGFNGTLYVLKNPGEVNHFLRRLISDRPGPW